MDNHKKHEINDIERDMNEDPLGFRKKHNMSRTDFRAMKREKNKYYNAIDKMNPTQRKAMQILINDKAKEFNERIEIYTVTLNASVNALMWDYVDNWSVKRGEEFWDQVNELTIDGLKCNKNSKKLSREEWTMLEKQVKEFIIKKLNEGENAAKIKDAVAFKFNTLSNAQIKNAYAETKAEWCKATITEDPKIKPDAKKKVEKASKEVIKESEVKVDKVAEKIKTKEQEDKKLGIFEQLEQEFKYKELRMTYLSNDVAEIENTIKNLLEAKEQKQRLIEEVKEECNKINQIKEMAQGLTWMA